MICPVNDIRCLKYCWNVCRDKAKTAKEEETTVSRLTDVRPLSVSLPSCWWDSDSQQTGTPQVFPAAGKRIEIHWLCDSDPEQDPVVSVISLWIVSIGSLVRSREIPLAWIKAAVGKDLQIRITLRLIFENLDWVTWFFRARLER